MSVTGRVDAYQRRRQRLGFPIAVLYKYIDDSGGNLAALLTYYGFLSLFPLLLLGSTVLGIVLAGDPEAQQSILNSALSQFPVIGEQLHQPERLGGGAMGLLVGGLGALYGGLGGAVALQNAMNTAWTVPKNNRPNPVKARIRGLLLLATCGSALLATTILSALGGGAGALGAGMRVLVLVASVTVNAIAFVVAFRLATARPLSVRDVAPGAIAAALIWQLLQWFGATYVGHVIKDSSATNGVFALVLGLIAFMYAASVSVLLCAEINVVRVDRLHPRALLTPLTDNVELTDGDRRAYTRQAKAQRNKGFEQIDVHYDR
ncbi:MAG TPA: YihY/virulence factor BrkB family protein [Sporichthya sp.]|nr:YihY/virulence factor BrkB family protein [Sporichthya sp.]